VTQLFELTRQHAILAELCDEIGVALTDSRIVGTAIALYGASGTGGRVGAANLPADYRHVTIANSPARETEAKAYELIGAYAATFARLYTDDERTIKSLYLHSAAKGNGKTTSAAALVNAYIRASYVGAVREHRQAPQRPAFFLDANEWQTLFNRFNRSRVPDSIAEPAAAQYYRWLDAAQRAPFVACDDIGVRGATEAFRGDLHSVINYRTTNRLPTVFTSNEPIEALADVFDERLYDRARDQAVVIEFTGESRRGLRK
jgi:DNA replication protein DnaC